MPAHNLRGRCWARRLRSSFVGRLRNQHGWLYGDGVANVSNFQLVALVNVSCEKALPTVVCSEKLPRSVEARQKPWMLAIVGFGQLPSSARAIELRLT